MISALVWVIIGVLLILSELLATSVIAVFFGVAAITVGVLTYAEILQSASMQFMIFGISSVLLLVLLRRFCRSWFVGFTHSEGEAPAAFTDLFGERITVATDFTNGAGRVVLNGVQWDAESDEPLKTGDIAFITAHNGIKLRVSKTAPTRSI